MLFPMSSTVRRAVLASQTDGPVVDEVPADGDAGGDDGKAYNNTWTGGQSEGLRLGREAVGCKEKGLPRGISSGGILRAPRSLCETV